MPLQVWRRGASDIRKSDGFVAALDVDSWRGKCCFISVMTNIFSIVAIAASSSVGSASLIITGVFDGPLSGGTPKVVEVYASTAIGDLSQYALEYYFNANATPGTTISLSGAAAAGDFFYFTPNTADFATYFGLVSDYSGGSINGDDSLRLQFDDGSGAVTVDQFGSPSTDGTGEAWEYLDGWAYRNDDTGPSATFSTSDWVSSGINVTDGDTTNATSGSPFPIGSFTVTSVPEPSTALLGGLAFLGFLRRRR